MNPTNPRQLALEILQRVATGGYADRSLDEALRRLPQLDPRDRSLTTELVYGVLRQQNRLDHVLGKLTKTPLARMEQLVVLMLRLGAYQILELDRIPARAAVHETVELARRIRLERATGLINAVLRRLSREQEQIAWPDPVKQPVAHLTWAGSLPKWLAKRWHKELGSEALQLADCLLQPAPFSLRVNTLKVTREQLLEALDQAGHTAVASRFVPEGITLTTRGPAALPGDAEGWYQVQDEASMLIAHLIDPQPGERLLDTCAAPGGKTTHLAALTDNRAVITALDLHPHRVQLIEQGARRLGCQQIETRVCDLTGPPDFLDKESFDAVLVDAPCSGLGVLRRNPEARWRLQPEDLADLADRQAAILEQAATLLRPGGRLVYSVCTTTPEETDLVIDAFLAGHPEFQRQPLADLVPEAWQELLDDRGQLRCWPHRHGLDGFFAVRLIKT